MRRRILLRLNAIDISAAVVTVATQTYSGSALTPTPSVILNGSIIPSDGYNVTYSNNINVGTATITIVGNGTTYKGTVTQTFTIVKASINPSVNLNSWVEGETALNPSVSGNIGNGSISYRYKLLGEDDSTYTTTKPNAAGAYVVKASISLTANTYEATATNLFRIILTSGNIVKYHAVEKLAESSNYKTSGVLTNAFYHAENDDLENALQLNMVSHTFNNGVGVLEFDGIINYIKMPTFAGCDGLILIVFPDSGAEMRFPGSAINGCSRLSSFYVSRYMIDLAVLNNSAFLGTCGGLNSLVVDENNLVYDSRNNCNAIIVSETGKLLKGCNNTIIPNGVTSIDGNAFYQCSNLTSITIPDSVIDIGSAAFSYTGLISIIIPNSVNNIANSLFYCCSDLTSATLSNNATTIGDSAFYQCSNLTSITIPDSVTTIDRYAFFGCSSLSSIVIPANITVLGEKAFGDCTSLLGITCRATIPPTIDNTTFENTTCLIRVPVSALNSYKASWTSVSSRLVGY